MPSAVILGKFRLLKRRCYSFIVWKFNFKKIKSRKIPLIIIPRGKGIIIILTWGEGELVGALEDFGEMTWLLSPEGRLVGQNLSLGNLSKIRCLLGRILEYYKGLVRESGKFYSDTTRILLFSVNSPPPSLPDKWRPIPKNAVIFYQSNGNIFELCVRW